ncbi:fumarylacetoacetate hydrolase family protein [Phenylobacterium sp.]|uniref:fumarylacetoacetate hydrolase family protein n=1 Tax=Phenylobacterium sp. TaxID=1871053 RepID=UPI00281233CA|nr:fumarylacetoacetate hydrolase family protein [Phenylobacterium sp.]
MKIARFEHGGRIGLGLVKGDGVIDLSVADASIPADMIDLIAGGDRVLEALRKIEAATAPHLALQDVRLLAPIPRPPKYLAIGMNYAKHVAEAKREGIERPAYQYWFNKQTSCVHDPFADIVKPAATEMLDYEVELGVVIGRTARRVPVEKARDYIFGYVVSNDISARDWQRHTPSFTMGKSFDTFGPIGPWIVTADEVPDPHQLALRCWVNGELRQSSNTSEMISNCYDQIAYVSIACTLEPGDVIATGTPEGVGLGMHPPSFLKAGDVVRCEVELVGAIEARVVDAA